MIRIEIDRDSCCGSGNCMFWAPATFSLDDSGVSVVLDPEGDPEERVRVAAEGCPTRAIAVFDDGEERQEGTRADRAVR